MAEPKTGELMEKIVSLCKRRGFIFQSSEIYGGLNGFWDYGPLGAELKRNIKECWWRAMTQLRDDVAGLDAAMLHQIGDLAGDHAGLSGAGTGEHQKWAADVVHGFLLPRVESGHGVQVIRSGGGSLTGCRADAGPLQVQ